MLSKLHASSYTLSPPFGQLVQLFLNVKNVDLNTIQNDSLSKILAINQKDIQTKCVPKETSTESIYTQDDDSTVFSKRIQYHTQIYTG